LPISDTSDEIVFVIPFMSVKDFLREFRVENPIIPTSDKTFYTTFKKCEHIRLMRYVLIVTFYLCDVLATDAKAIFLDVEYA
jgi:VanZ family protein